jgi:hypothetical protein
MGDLPFEGELFSFVCQLSFVFRASLSKLSHFQTHLSFLGEVGDLC